MKKILLILLTVFIVSVLVIWLGVKDTFNPVSREQISQKVFTIGDLSYKQALDNNRKVVKFGPAFWGLYPGGLAFSKISDAENFFREKKATFTKVSDKWAVYQLSGDFSKDAKKRGETFYTDKSLFVIKWIKQL